MLVDRYRRHIRLGAVAIIPLFSIVNAAASPSETIIHRFDIAHPANGATPFGNLIVGTNGVIYGTTANGGYNCPEFGAGGCGTIFELIPPASGQTGWTYAILYKFRGRGDGAYPINLVAGQNGSLFGETTYGGIETAPIPCTDSSYGVDGCGTVFELTPPAPGNTVWTHQVLYRFRGYAYGDGQQPSSVMISPTGTLYLTTQYGGNGYCYAGASLRVGCGTVFRLRPPAAGKITWRPSVLYSFGGSVANPFGTLLLDNAGSLYGTTSHGINSPGGTAFKLTPPLPGKTAWTESLIYNFTGKADGGYPVAGLMLGASGALYGTTSQGGGLGTGCSGSGCGTVFKLTPQPSSATGWTETTIYTFTGAPHDGEYPEHGNLIEDKAGAIYGTTYYGGAATYGSGTVFKLVPPTTGSLWSEKILYTFQPYNSQGTQLTGDGSQPYDGVVFGPGGALFGTCFTGGSTMNSGGGIVFKITQ